MLVRLKIYPSPFFMFFTLWHKVGGVEGDRFSIKVELFKTGVHLKQKWGHLLLSVFCQCKMASIIARGRGILKFALRIKISVFWIAYLHAFFDLRTCGGEQTTFDHYLGISWMALLKRIKKIIHRIGFWLPRLKLYYNCGWLIRESKCYLKCLLKSWADVTSSKYPAANKNSVSWANQT